MHDLHISRKNYFAFYSSQHILCNMTGLELKNWRKAKGLSQGDLGTMLGVSHTAVNRWEGGQEIPGPALKLLRMLIFGEQPFASAETASNPLWEITFSLAEWEELERRRLRAGFGSVRELLAYVVRESLQDQAKSPAPPSQHPPSPPVLLKAAETPATYRTKKGA